MILKEVLLKPLAPPPSITLKTEHGHGLKYAVVYEDRSVLALFSSEYSANFFIEKSGFSRDLTIREVADA